jgi:methyltransferase
VVTRLLFTLLVATVAVQRLLEVIHSQRNERLLFEQGGREHAAGQMRPMKVLHTAWLASAVAEVWLLAPPFRPWLAIAALALFALGQTFRVLAMRALGHRWTVRVITLPAAPPVAGGIYRWLRHPNYLGVILEIAALPLVHGAVYTALLFSVANLSLLARRIQAEETALASDNDYFDHLGTRPRLLPWPSRSRNSSQDSHS